MTTPKKSRIYTRRGDQGKTKLPGGYEVDKSHPVIEACGSIDELNCALGSARSLLDDPSLGDRLSAIQQQLFELGAWLARPETAGAAVLSGYVPELEGWIDEYDQILPELRSFILPAGEPAAAALHLARSICRRAERRAVEARGEGPGEAVVYLNRLSDLLFVMARVVNHKSGRGDVVWKK